MSSTSWTPSEKGPVNFLDGALQTNSITPLDQQGLKFVTQISNLPHASSHDIWSWAYFHSVGTTLGSKDEWEYSSLNQRNFWARLGCHLIIDKIPEEGLQEACESLSEIYNFYTELPPPANRTLLEPQPIQVTLSASYERPAFQLTEE